MELLNIRMGSGSMLACPERLDGVFVRRSVEGHHVPISRACRRRASRPLHGARGACRALEADCRARACPLVSNIGRCPTSTTTNSAARQQTNYERRQGKMRRCFEGGVFAGREIFSGGEVFTAKQASSTFSANSLGDSTNTP
jgi:hypothetical protein